MEQSKWEHNDFISLKWFVSNMIGTWGWALNNELVMILNQNSMKVELGNTERDKLLTDMTQLFEHTFAS